MVKVYTLFMIWFTTETIALQTTLEFFVRTSFNMPVLDILLLLLSATMCEFHLLHLGQPLLCDQLALSQG